MKSPDSFSKDAPISIGQPTLVLPLKSHYPVDLDKSGALDDFKSLMGKSAGSPRGFDSKVRPASDRAVASARPVPVFSNRPMRAPALVQTGSSERTRGERTSGKSPMGGRSSPSDFAEDSVSVPINPQWVAHAQILPSLIKDSASNVSLDEGCFDSFENGERGECRDQSAPIESLASSIQVSYGSSIDFDRTPGVKLSSSTATGESRKENKAVEEEGGVEDLQAVADPRVVCSSGLVALRSRSGWESSNPMTLGTVLPLEVDKLGQRSEIPARNQKEIENRSESLQSQALAFEDWKQMPDLNHRGSVRWDALPLGSGAASTPLGCPLVDSVVVGSAREAGIESNSEAPLTFRQPDEGSVQGEAQAGSKQRVEQNVWLLPKVEVQALGASKNNQFPKLEEVGTDDASERKRMNNPGQMTEIAESSGQFLLGQEKTLVSEGLLSVPLTVGLRPEEITLSPKGVTSETNAGGTGSTQRLDRLAELVSTEASLLRQFRPGVITAVVRPDLQSEVRIELRMQRGQVEVRATLERGDAEGFKAGWSDLQTSLQTQGIRLQPFESKSSFVETTASSTLNFNGDFGSQPQRQRDLESNRQLPPIGSNSLRVSSGASVSGHPGVSSRGDSSLHLLESWA